MSLPLCGFLAAIVAWVRAAKSRCTSSCNKSEFPTTMTEDIPISAPEMEGVRQTPRAGRRAPAAKGMAMTLYPKAHTRFCLILASVLRLKWMASDT